MRNINNIGIKSAYLSRALIPLVDRSTKEVRPGSDENELDDVEKIIVEEYRFRSKLTGPRQRTSDGLGTDEWLRTTLYGVILVWLDSEYREDLINRVPKRMRTSDALAASPALLFHETIAAVLVNNPKIITASQRSRLAEPMWYAFRHYIPTELLLGFNRQYPRHRDEDEALLNEIEPIMAGWIKEQRLYSKWRGGELDEYRGRYPSEIEDYVLNIVNRFY